MAGFITAIIALPEAYAQLHGISPRSVPDLNEYLIVFPAMILWLPVGLVIANCVLFVVPPFRRVADAYVARAQRPGFYEAQWSLLKGVLVFAAVCVPLIILGFVL